MKQTEEIIRCIRQHYPEVQAVYLFGTYGTDDEGRAVMWMPVTHRVNI